MEILLSKDSIAEYPTFFRDVIEKKLNYVLFDPPIYDFLDEKKIIVTGEHGDQIFGSDKAQHFVLTNQAFRPFEEILPIVIARKLGSTKSVDAIISYLAPQIEKSPVKIKTLFDFLVVDEFFAQMAARFSCECFTRMKMKDFRSIKILSIFSARKIFKTGQFPITNLK